MITLPSSSLIVDGEAPRVYEGPAGARTLVTTSEPRNNIVTEKARSRVALFFRVIRVRATAGSSCDPTFVGSNPLDDSRVRKACVTQEKGGQLQGSMPRAISTSG